MVVQRLARFRTAKAWQSKGYARKRGGRALKGIDRHRQCSALNNRAKAMHSKVKDRKREVRIWLNMKASATDV